MRTRSAAGARRLAVVAGTLCAVATATLPFAGNIGPPDDRLATIAGVGSAEPAPPSTAPSQASPPAEAPPDEPAARLVLRAPEPPPAPPPPPPPPPEGADLDPAIGVVPGEGEVPQLVVPPPPPPPQAPSAADPSARPGERVWAVVVGIDDYPGRRSDLAAAAADARDLVAGLLRLGVPAGNVLALYDQEATLPGLVAAVDWLVANAGPDDTAVFFFAGHVRALGGGTETIVTADAGWVTDWFLADRLAGLAARDAWFVLAACYGGGFDELLGPGRILTAAAGPGELAYESGAYGRSYLGEFLLRRGILGGEAGEPTVQAAVLWAAARLAEAHPTRQLWHEDQAGHVVSLDGIRRDGSDPTVPAPAAPPPRNPVEELLAGGRPCLLGILLC